MTEKEKCKQGLLYDANYDIELLKLRTIAKDLCFQYNHLTPSDVEAQQAMFERLVAKVGKDFVVTAPFWCDYGENIFIGDNFYSNHNLTILDAALVSIGSNVFIGPNCCISTAGHPIDKEQRNKGLEFAYPVTIKDNVWIGANVVVLAGVEIGENSVIGAGSVVVKSIPSNCVAVGNPCKFLRQID